MRFILKKYLAVICSCLLLVTLFSSCAASVSYKSISEARQPKPDGFEVQVFQENETIAKKNTTLGLISVDDSGFTVHCSYDIVLEKAKEKAREIGADAIKIVKVESPDLISSCYRLKALAVVFD
jgi:hypothetical protein